MTTIQYNHCSTVRRGFSFVEVLFAIMVLGVGFIMIAAIFPVAISQSKATVEETAAGRVELNAKRVLAAMDIAASFYTETLSPGLSSDNTFPNNEGTFVPPTPDYKARGIYISARDPRQVTTAPGNALWDAIKGSLIDSADPRMAWTPLFSQDEMYEGGVRVAPGPLKTSLFIVAARSTPAYTNNDLFRYNAGTLADGDANVNWATLQPRLVRVYLTDGGAGSGDLLEVLPCGNVTRLDGSGPVAVPDFTEAVGEGSWVFISDDRVALPTIVAAPFSTALPYTRGEANGRYYRVGVRRADLDATTAPLTKAWELEAGRDLEDNKKNLPPIAGGSPAVAFIMGRGWSSVTSPGTFEGPVQDLNIGSGN